MNSVNPTSASNAGVGQGSELNQDEQARLIRAMESAIAVQREAQFHAWLSGPFRDLLPHEVLVQVKFCQGNANRPARPMACLNQGLLDADAMHALCEPQHGVIGRLLTAPAVASSETSVAETSVLHTLSDGPVQGSARTRLRNATIRNVMLQSGDSYGFVLCNMPDELLARCPVLFTLVAAHLKMALARVQAEPEHAGKPALTPRELEVLQSISMGKSNREISESLGISAITVKNHVSKLYRKLNVQSRAEAVARGLSRTPDQTAPG